jgi:hypothetical protein
MQVVRGSYSRELVPARAWAALTCGLPILTRDFAEPSMAGPNGRADDARVGACREAPTRRCVRSHALEVVRHRYAPMRSRVSLAQGRARQVQEASAKAWRRQSGPPSPSTRSNPR